MEVQNVKKLHPTVLLLLVFATGALFHPEVVLPVLADLGKTPYVPVKGMVPMVALGANKDVA